MSGGRPNRTSSTISQASSGLPSTNGCSHSPIAINLQIQRNWEPSSSNAGSAIKCTKEIEPRSSKIAIGNSSFRYLFTIQHPTVCFDVIDRPSPSFHYYQEVIAERTQQRPAGRAPIGPPQPFITPWKPVPHPGQVRRRHTHAQSPIELAWRVVASPDSMFIHPNRHDIAGKPYFHPRPVPLPRVMGDLPWAP